MSHKRIYADDLAAGLGFEWNYEEADDRDLFEALEAMGYTWDEGRSSWIAPRYATTSKPVTPRRQRTRQSDAERLADWNAGAPIRGKK